MYQELMASGRHGRPHNKLESPKEVMVTLHEMAAAMREQATATHRMMEQMERRSKENLEGHNGEAEVNLEYLKFAEFKKENRPSFKIWPRRRAKSNHPLLLNVAPLD